MAGNKDNNGSQEEGRTKRFLFGITAGGGLATSRFDYKSVVAPSILSYRLAPVAGLTIDWRLFNSLSFDLNLLYREKGNKIDVNQWFSNIRDNDPEPSIGETTAEGFSETRLSYFEGSFMPVLVIGRFVEIGAGVFAGYGLTGKRMVDYSVKNSEIPDFLMPGQAVKEEFPAEFILVAPGTEDDEKLYVNALDYGYCGHLGFRMNPFKISFGVTYSTKSWEPAPGLADMFSDNVDFTYNLTGMVTLSWFFGAKK
jgi:hypothetical protein